MSDIAIEAAKEIEKIALENNISVHELIEEYKKRISKINNEKGVKFSEYLFKEINPKKL